MNNSFAAKIKTNIPIQVVHPEVLTEGKQRKQGVQGIVTEILLNTITKLQSTCLVDIYRVWGHGVLYVGK